MAAKISLRAIERFLDRPRKNFDRYKSFSDDELQRKADALPIKPPVWFALNKDQRVCFVIGARRRRFAFWADTGTGKTFLSIALHRYFYKLEELDRTLVLVPAKVNKYEWAREIRKHSPKTSYVVLKGSSANKWQQIQGDEQIIIESYGGMVRMLTEFVKAKKRGRKRLVLEPSAVLELAKHVGGLILDESIMTVFKGKHGSLMHRACYQLAKRAKVVFALNATPHGRDVTDLWGQMRIIDQGETLGETLALFRAAFFKAKENYWGGYEYTFKTEMWSELNRIIGNRSIRIEADESTLPAVVPIIKHISLPADAQAVYDDAKRKLIASRGNFTESKNAFMLMRQISSGYVGYYDDEEGRRAKYAFETNPKLDMLMSLLDRVHRDYKSVIFHDFVFSGSRIEAALEKEKIGYVRLHGSKQDPLELLDRFDNDDDCRVFILNNFEGYGLNLQVARYGFYYESPVPVIKRKQTSARVRRQRSKHNRVFLYDLVVRGTMDERILDFHKMGGDLFEAVINGDPRQLLGVG